MFPPYGAKEAFLKLLKGVQFARSIWQNACEYTRVAHTS